VSKLNREIPGAIFEEGSSGTGKTSWIPVDILSDIENYLILKSFFQRYR
jgi:hypothetical protein